MTPRFFSFVVVLVFAIVTFTVSAVTIDIDMPATPTADSLPAGETVEVPSVTSPEKRLLAYKTYKQPKTYSNKPIKPGQCQHNQERFEKCYLCGKVVESLPIYTGCCELNDAFVTYCDALLK